MSESPFHKVREALRNGHSLQIHCDGGFREGIGAAAFVPHIVEPSLASENALTRAGYVGIYLDVCHSAFHAEIVALDAAITFVLELVTDGSWRRKRKTVLFNDF